MSTAASHQVLEEAEWPVILKVVRESYKIWSSGLAKAQFYHYTWWQLNQPWSKRNYRFFILRDGTEILASCKLYTLEIMSRGKSYKAGGVGAVYTMEKHRNKGHGSTLLKEIAKLARSESYDLLMLHSDIDAAYYEKFGFRKLGAHEFYIFPEQPDVFRILDTIAGKGFEGVTEAAPVQQFEIPLMVGHHTRWQRSNPFGLKRSEDYWAFKLGKENYLLQHSQRGWPQLQIISDNLSKANGGYALFEQTEQIMRVLEVVGTEETVEKLWRKLFSLALLSKKQMIRGWEAVAPELLKNLKWAEREYAHPMILPLTKEPEAWLDVYVCPFLELDHF